MAVSSAIAFAPRPDGGRGSSRLALLPPVRLPTISGWKDLHLAPELFSPSGRMQLPPFTDRDFWRIIGTHF